MKLRITPADEMIVRGEMGRMGQMEFIRWVIEDHMTRENPLFPKVFSQTMTRIERAFGNKGTLVVGEIAALCYRVFAVAEERMMREEEEALMNDPVYTAPPENRKDACEEMEALISILLIQARENPEKHKKPK